MELNKNKIIFIVVWVILLLSMVFLMILSKWADNNETNTSEENTFKIWMVWDSWENTYNIIDWFKKFNTAYQSKNIIIETFPDYEEYTYALTSAINSWVWPDLFVLNNNEDDSIFSNQVIWIPPSVISPNDFRKRYKWVFSDDLISWEWDDEFLKWIPVWYETLWIFYNRAQVRHSDLDNISSLNNIISKLSERNPWTIPLGIWNGSTVKYAADILTQFFMLEWDVEELDDVTWNVLKQWLASYLLYWDINWYNSYDSRFLELTNLWENSLYLFSRGDIHMVVWYPSMVNDISDYWYSSSFLQARVFPQYFSGEGNYLINYNYFVINKDTNNINLAQDFLSYISNDSWASVFLNNFKYYLPSLLSLDAEFLPKKIHSDFNVVLEDFYADEYMLSSFDKWIKNIYDSKIISILDNWAYAESNFEQFANSLMCKTKKIINFESLSKDCN